MQTWSVLFFYIILQYIQKYLYILYIVLTLIHQYFQTILLKNIYAEK